MKFMFVVGYCHLASHSRYQGCVVPTSVVEVCIPQNARASFFGIIMQNMPDEDETKSEHGTNAFQGCFNCWV